MSSIVSFIIAFLACLAPILAWLWFLEHEDKHPEPHMLTALAFIGGMLAVFVAIYFEKKTLDVLGNSTLTVIIWAAIEELCKLAAAALTALRLSDNDEPVDSMMYLITAALGFSLLENTLFLMTPILSNHYLSAVIVGNYRFLGATILHVIASSTIGASLALAYYKNGASKRLYLFFGIIVAITLHASFNLSIMYLDDAKAAIPFYAVWILFVGVLLAFEKVKHITNPSN